MAETANTAIIQIHMFHGWSRYSTWMKAIARHRILSLIKKKTARLKAEEYHENFRAAEAVHNPITQCESDQNICELLGCLSEKERSIVVGKVFHNKTFKKLAAELCLSADAVASRYYKAIKKLKENVVIG